MSITDTEKDFAINTEPFAQACEQAWPADQPRPAVLTRAPGRLDCMGGIADFAGALALQATIEPAAYVAAGRRDDQRVLVRSIGWVGDCTFDWPLAAFYQSDGQFVTGAKLAEQLKACPWALHVAGVCLGLLESGDVPHLAGGVTLVLNSDIPPGMGLASSAAIQVATARAIGALFHADLNLDQVMRACRLADGEVVGSEPGLVDHVTCLMGEPRSLLQLRCQPDDVLGHLRLPDGVMLVGVQSGVRMPIRHERYTSNRIASMMGRVIVERIVELRGHDQGPAAESLGSISPNEYVRHFRNDLPVKLKGQEFLAHFDPPEEFEGRIEPDQIYKVRSRTEHHIYEHDRTHRFLERLSRARRTGERDALVEAGELMYASHWSYGQRCGMGSIETDILVNAIRAEGAARGLYGAKTTGCGCGGTVAVLIADSPTARETLEKVCSLYEQKTGHQATVLAGSSPGAMAFGHRELS